MCPLDNASLDNASPCKIIPYWGGGLYGLLQAFFIERDPHSRAEIGERDIVLSA
jgi:hypothetical protein